MKLSNKVLDFMGLSYEDLVGKEEINRIKRRLYKERSNVFSYYVLTCIIMQNPEKFVRWCAENNHNMIKIDPEVVNVCDKHLSKIGEKATTKNSVKCVWGDAFESIKKVEENKYDKIFVDLNDDQYCIDLAAKNIKSLKRILKSDGTITAQVGSQDKKPKQVEKWLNLFQKSFGNTSLDRIYIPSFDCSWNFASSINK